MKKILIFVLFFFFLALIQTSFLIHFDIYGVSLNLVLISVILVNFFEKPWQKTGLVIAAIGGFYLDLFSNFQIGVSLLVLVVLALLIKRILKTLKEENILYFIPVFILAIAFYGFFSVLLNSALELSFPSFSCLDKLKILGIFYNLLVGIIGFYLIKLCSGRILRR